MNKEYLELMVTNLLEENRKLKQELSSLKNLDEKLLNEKINFIRFVFTIFENCKVLPADTSVRLVLFGDFLENLLYRKSINKNDLTFCFNTNFNNTNNILTIKQKFFNILNNTDYIQLTTNQQVSLIYKVKKNNKIFNVIFYNNDNYSNLNYFNSQNIEFDSVYGLKIKKLSPFDTKQHITNPNIAFLNLMKSIYLNKLHPIVDSISQSELSVFLDIQENFKKDGYEIENGIKIITLDEQCSICYGQNLKGVILNCNHTYCVNCIQRHLNTNYQDNDYRDKKCPLCRSSINIVFE